jgi:hypothetical protein
MSHLQPSRIHHILHILFTAMMLVPLVFAGAGVPRSAAAAPDGAEPAGQVPAGVTSGEWSSMLALVREAEYQFAWHEPAVQTALPYYWAPNRAQAWDLVFDAQGMSVTSPRPDQSWRWGLRLASAGYAGTAQPAGAAQITAVDNRLEYRYSGLPGLIEWYVNSTQGLEQGFTLESAFAGQTAGTNLHIDLAILGTLSARLSKNRQAVDFVDSAGRLVLSYDHLKVTDATGKTLPAFFALLSGGRWQRTVLRILIDDRQAAYPLTVDPLATSQLVQIVASGHAESDFFDGQTDDYFGYAVSLSGDRAVVGAWSNDYFFMADRGAAYVFERDDEGLDAWGMIKKLVASDGAVGDQFGRSVAISYDTILVGAPSDDVSSNVDQGSAYIFERNQGGADLIGQVAHIYGSSPAGGDQFGWAVSLSGDTAIVGAPTQPSAGTAFIFERNQGGASAWGEVKALTSGSLNPDDFGSAVGISIDTAIVGAPNESSGQGGAYIFERNAGGTAENWGQVAARTVVAAGGQFGASVAISGDAAIVGAPGTLSNTGAAYILDRNSGGADNWGVFATLGAPDAAAGDQFGKSVSISDETALVGSPYDNLTYTAQGSAYLFERNAQGEADVWGQVKKIKNSAGEQDDYFGFAVSISGDTVLVGSYSDSVTNVNQGTVFIFQRTGDDWYQLAHPTYGNAGDNFGHSVSISGDTAIVGASGSDIGGLTHVGAAYILERNTASYESWGQVKKLTASDGAEKDWYGRGVAIHGDTAVVGASLNDNGAVVDQGKAYIYQRNTGGIDNWGEVKALLASDGAANDDFGRSVTISGDTIVVGAPNRDPDANTFFTPAWTPSHSGAAYVFERNFGGVDNWGEVKKLTPSDGAAGDAFGTSVSLSVHTVVVGAPWDDSGSGSVYLYDRNQGGADNWGQLVKKGSSTRSGGDRLGHSVSISGDTFLAGAWNDSFPVTNQGAAFLYERNFGGLNNWGEFRRLTASDGAVGDRFGETVALDVDTAIIGAAYDDNGNPGDDRGSVYIYERNKGSANFWGEVVILTAGADAGIDDNFGLSVGLSGSNAVIGVPYDNIGAAGDQGSAFIFRRRDAVSKPVTGIGPITLGGDTNLLLNITDRGPGNCLTNIAAPVTYTDAPFATTNLEVADKYWAITPTGCSSGFTLNMTVGTKPVPTTLYTVCRDATGTGGWDCNAHASDIGDKTVTRNNVTALSNWTYGPEAPTAVTLASFYASSQVNAVLLHWEAVWPSEVDRFLIFRAASPNDTPVQIGEVLAVPLDPLSGSASYTFLDDTASSGAKYYYWLVDVSFDGHLNWTGPKLAISLYPDTVYLPYIRLVR